MKYSRKQAEEVAYGLGLSLYFNEDPGLITQVGPGELIDPGHKSRPTVKGPGGVDLIKNVANKATS